MRYYRSSEWVLSRPRGRAAVRSIPISAVLSVAFAVFLIFSVVFIRSLEHRFAYRASLREMELRTIRNERTMMMMEVTRGLVSITGEGQKIGRRIYVVPDPAETLSNR